jgi:hypothetical protein
MPASYQFIRRRYQCETALRILHLPRNFKLLIEA